MPHDAVNIDTATTIPVRTHRKHTGGYDPGWTSYANQHVSRRDILIMPASTSNPKREDGTRAPSAYWTKHAIIRANPKHFSQVNPGIGVIWGYYTFESSTAFYTPAVWLGTSAALFSWALSGSLVRTNVDARARTKFLNNLGSVSGKDRVQLGVAAGEVRETIGLASELGEALLHGILSTAKKVSQSPGTIATALYSLERLGFKETARRFFSGDANLLDKVVSSWLVYQFGIKPLAYDLYDAEIYLKTRIEQDYYHLDVTVRGGAEQVDDVELAHNTWAANGGTYYISGVYRQITGVHYSCKYRIPTQATMAEQLGVNNPAFVLWELARFSWALDKFIEVGKWFHSFMAASGTQFQEGSRSEIRRSSLLQLVDRTESTLGWGKLQGFDPFDVPFFQVEQFDRVVLAGGVMPSFLPGVKNTMGLTQVANLVAALTTLSGSRAKWPNPGII